MSKISIGARVGAILSANSKEVQLLGYGVYDGEHEPPFGPLGMNKDEYDKIAAEMKREGKLPEDFVWKNPRITLDDGTVIWGAQCWWGTEDSIRSSIGDRQVIQASVSI